MREITFTQSIRETLASEMRRDPNVVLLGEDIATYGGAFGVTRGLVEEFSEKRVIDTPISEQALTGVAIGAAVAGMRPVIEFMFMDFILLAADQLINMAAKLFPIYSQACPIVVRAPAGGGRGYGATHSQTLERIFFGIPGLKIAAPANASDGSALLQSAIQDNNPVLFLEHKMLYPQRFAMCNDLPAPLAFGKAAHLHQGNDLTIIAWSYMSCLARRAASELATEGINADVIDLRTLVPLDIETLVESAQRTGRVMIVEEGSRTGGIAAEIATQIMEQAHDYLEKPIMRITGADFPVPSSRHLETACLPTESDIITNVHELIL